MVLAHTKFTRPTRLDIRANLVHFLQDQIGTDMIADKDIIQLCFIAGKAGWESATGSLEGLQAMAIVYPVSVNYTSNSQLYVMGSRPSQKF